MSDTPKSHGRLSIQASLKPRELMTPTPRLARAWRAKVITLFPEAFPGTLGLSLMGQALKNGLWSLETTQLRDYGLTKHRNVDDTPAGGGAGLVIRADVLGPAIEATMQGTAPGHRLIYLSPRGTPFTQDTARSWAAAPGVTLICGRFEGVDQRVLDHFGVEEISLGDFVLSGGEIAAQAMLDATLRLIPGVLGNLESTVEESFSNGLLEHPQYTKPAEWQGRAIPEVLLSGNHAKVAQWRREQALALTRARRPDLIEKP